MTEIRTERDNRLLESDKEKNRLDDVGSQAERDALATKRQELRDIPAGVDLDAIATPEALESFQPSWPTE